MNSPANLIGDPLGEADYAALEARWITRDAADAALLRRVDLPQGAEFVGQAGRAGDYAGILIPYLWPGDGSVRDYRLRRDHPDLEQERMARSNRAVSTCLRRAAVTCYICHHRLSRV